MAVSQHQSSAALIALIDDNRIVGFGIAGGLLLFVVATGCALWLLPIPAAVPPTLSDIFGTVDLEKPAPHSATQ
jgi:hypothetical protein